MALQIRRGPTADRMSYTPVVGELIWDTSTNSLYIGNGTTAGGLPAGTLVTEDVQDIASSMLVDGTHNNIAFTYNDTTGRINSAIDLTTYDGTIEAPGFKGSVYASDSSLLLNALTGAVNLDGTIKGNVVPDANETYDLGSASYRFRDIYLSGSSINLGAATITASGSVVDLPAGSTVDGVLIGSGSGTGDGVIEGSNYVINIAGADSTTAGGLIVDSATYQVRAAGGLFGNLTGNVTGDVLGNVTGNVLGNVTGNVITNFISSIDSSSIICDTPVIFQTTVRIENDLTLLGPLRINEDVIITTNSSNLRMLNLVVAGNEVGEATSSGAVFRRSRGTVDSPTTVVDDDTLGTILFNGYDGSGNYNGASIRASVDGTVSSLVVPGKVEFNVSDSAGLSTNILRLSGKDKLATIFSATRIISNDYSLATPILAVQQNHSTVDGRNISFLRGRGTALVPSAILTGDDVVDLTFNGFDGTTYIGGLSISAIVDGAVSTGVVPTSLVISTNVGFGNTTRITISSLGDLTSTRAIRSSGTQGIGYATGAGGTGSQGSAKTDTVTINKPTGEITTFAASLAADTNVSFTLSNTSIAVGDHVIVSHISGGTLGAYNVCAIAAASSATITIRNITSGSLTEAPVIKFTVIKSVTA